MTVHTQADLDRLSAIARKKFSHAYMSDTKWRKVFAALDHAGIELSQIVVKFIEVSEPRTVGFPSRHAFSAHLPYMDTIEYGPVELRSIEWVDIPAIANFPRANNVPARQVSQNIDLAADVLDQLRCKVIRSAGSLRLLGYSR